MNKIKLLLRRYKIYKLYDKYFDCDNHYECQEIARKILELEQSSLSNERNKLIKQSIEAHCPRCNQEMCFHPDTKYDICNYTEEITCGNCGHTSSWYYATSTPILISGEK